MKKDIYTDNRSVIFKHYFSRIKADTRVFRKALLPLLNENWNKNSEEILAKIQSFSEKMDSDIYRECILATKDYINSRDFMVPNKYETTSYFYGAFQYNSESQALKNLNQKLDQLIQNIPEKNSSWQESFENLWRKTASTLFSAFDFAIENPVSTMAGLLYAQTALASAFPAVFNLSSLDGTNGFKINGEASDDFSGFSVSSAGDINGDGIDDLIISAQGADPHGDSFAGSSHVIFGKNGTWTTPLELSTLDGTNGFKINGEMANDRSGYSVSSAGDINGDGIDDLIIGAYGADPGGNSSAGSSYVIFGKNEAWTTPLELSMLNGANGFKINGEAASDYSGASVSSAGDINGDGIDDLIIGASGADPRGNSSAGSTYVIFGKNGTWTTPLELSTLDGTNGFKINGEAEDDYSGYSVSSAGDINGDGIADLIVGAYGAVAGGNNSAGSSYVIFGKNETWTTPLELSTLNGTNGFKINGEAEDDYSGYSVSSAGDINGDGIADLIVGAYGAVVGGNNYAGSSYVIFGKNETWTTPLELSTLNGANGFKINGEAAGDYSGYSVSSAGDINSDGIDDLIMGAYGAEPHGKSLAGSSYVIFGKNKNWATSLELSVLNGTTGFKINGEAAYDLSGCSVSSAGDINGDGIDDLIIGASGADPNDKSRAGSSYVIFGTNLPPVLMGNSSSIDYSENEPAKIIDDSITVTDVDSKNLEGGIVSIINNFQAEDGLNFVDQNGIMGVYNSTTGILTLTGAAKVAYYQAALRNITYHNLSDNSTLTPRNVSFIVNDRWHNSIPFIRTINIIAVNDLPVLSSDNTESLNYTENDPATIVDSSITISDVDDVNLANATIAVTNNFNATQDVLNFTNQNGIVGLYDGETGVLTLTGSSSIDNYQAALCNVTYQNLFDHPSINVRTVSFIVNDGYGNSNEIARLINIIPVNDVPIIILDAADLNYTENSDPVAIDPTLTVVDLDNANLTEAMVSIINNFDSEQDILIFIDQNNIDGSYNDTTGILSLAGSSSITNYQTALRSVEYENLSDNPTTNPRTISFVVNDDVGTSVSVTRNINIIPVNNAPVLTNNGGSLNYTENDPATIVDPSITVFDVDNINLADATVSITGNFDFMQDRLSFTNQNNIIGSYNSALGVLTLSGSSNVTNYQAALRSVKYNNLSENPTTADRTVSFIVSDGEASSTAITRVIHIMPVYDLPVITVSGSALSYTVKELAKIIDSNITIVDIDSADLYWATVSITNNFNSAQDVLSFIDQHGITGSYNNETGMLNLTGTSNVTNYQTALRDVRYENLSDNPITDPRAVSFVVNDGSGNSIAATRNITITSEPAPIDISGEDANIKVRNAIIGASISGFVVLCFFALKLYLNRKATQSLEKIAEAYETSTIKMQEDFHRNVIKPIFKAIFSQVQITGCFGYINDTIMQEYLNAVVKIINALHQLEVNIDLEHMSPSKQTILINEIAKQTRKQFVPEQSCCSWGSTAHYFKTYCVPDATAVEIEEKAEVVALNVKKALKKDENVAFIELVPVDSKQQYQLAQNVQQLSTVNISPLSRPQTEDVRTSETYEGVVPKFN